MMLRRIRLALAAFFFVGVTLLLLDFTGWAHHWLAWMAQIQFLPAVLALNVVVVVTLLLLTLIFGRIYCSVICPLGVMQDIMAWIGRKVGRKKLPYSYSPEKRWLRWGVLGVFVALLLSGLTAMASLIAPYSSYGRIAAHLLAPIYRWCNNGLALLAERAESYAFYETDVWLKSMPTLLIALATFLLLFVLAWRGGRSYCNTICPVGTLLGFLSRYSLFKVRIDESKCNRCGLCGKKCKASCIDSPHHAIDYSRCVACMNCIGHCKHGAISLKYGWSPSAHRPDRPSAATSSPDDAAPDKGRRSFLTATALIATTATIDAQQKKVDGGLAAVEDKVAPHRSMPILPPGAFSARHFAQHCTACQLCVSACPNGVLRPSSDLARLMQPEASYERGYCRPECTRCADVCPTDAIRPITREEKSSTRIGHAIWVRKNCIPLTDGVACGNCARHCPTGAIQMVPSDAADEHSMRIPVVNTERCIGCGACEYLCPARPFSAIYVEGHERQSTY